MECNFLTAFKTTGDPLANNQTLKSNELQRKSDDLLMHKCLLHTQNCHLCTTTLQNHKKLNEKKMLVRFRTTGTKETGIGK